MESEKWTDVNLVSSMLKLFFRKLPDPLITDGKKLGFCYIIYCYYCYFVAHTRHKCNMVQQLQFKNEINNSQMASRPYKCYDRHICELKFSSLSMFEFFKL